ncbi:SDR family oxidoreductase [Nisaea sp.]|uniref:SDR family oxidoreductase n=1 Tax=Nisaea sp. TaxID=2024842 RepID=UPI003B51D8D1
MNLKDKTAIVTGGSRGIGAAIARRLAGEGCAVLLNYVQDDAAAQLVVEEIEEDGGTAFAARADIAAPGAIDSLFDMAKATVGPVDILVNNAGTMRLAPLADATDSDLDIHLSVNLAGTFRGMRAGAKRLRDGGRIISLSSSVVGLYQPSYGLYAATKAAIEAMTNVLAKELGQRGITVNAIAPGPVETEFFLKGKPENLIAAITRSIPLGRLGQAGDVSAAVAFLAGPDGRWVNGQTIRVNGGVV